MSTPSDTPPGEASLNLATVRDVILSEGSVGHLLRDRLCGEYDRYLAALPLPRTRSVAGLQLAPAVVPPAPRGIALIAVGGLGRREVAPYSDLDLILVSTGGTLPDEAVERFWYRLWDTGVALDHATRTVSECLTIAGQDLPALLGMLWARPVAGDLEVAIGLRDRVRSLWRAEARKRMGELEEVCRRRWDRAGDGASALEPDLKLSRGGLRDGQLLQALAVAQVTDVRADVRRAHTVLLDVRGELHRHARRRGDVLRRQYQQSVGEALGMRPAGGQQPGDAALREVNLACRAIGHELTATLRRVAIASGGALTPQGSPGGRSVRRPLARDLVTDGREVALAHSARVGSDPMLMLRAARVAAETGLPLAPYLVRRFAERTAPLAAPWPAEARAEFVRILGGSAVVDVLETLDLAGLMTTILPAWEAVRGRAQHNAVHRHTVDRHLMDTVAAAQEFLRDVARPDLLLVAALLHDIGKIDGGDHAEVGARIAESAVKDMGFDSDDTADVTALVRHHLLLVDTATGRDFTDPRTIADVLDAVGGRLDVLDLLSALTEADARATGPAAWTPWRAALVRDLVPRVRRRAQDQPLPDPPTLAPQWQTVAETVDLAVLFDPGNVTGNVTVITPDRPGVLHRTAGVLALHGLQVRSATARTHAGKAVNTYYVEPVFGDLPDPVVLRSDLARTLAADGELGARLEKKEREYQREAATHRPPAASWLDRAATGATIVEVRADWSIGSLYRITGALMSCALEVQAARMRTWGNTVIDSFYVRFSGSALIPNGVRLALDEKLARIK